VAVNAGLDLARRFGSPRSYLPPHLADRIVAVSSTLDGERKHVTVLFADIKSSLELLADRDPEDARKLLDPVLTLMMKAVHHYEGTVNQVMGDGIMALFGAPIAHEDHALRACYAALRIQEHIERYSKDTLVSMGVPVQVRIGINAGEVIVRGIRSDLAMDYTAVGSTVHLAGRLEQMATPSTILTTAATLALVEGFVRVRRIGPVPVRGLATRVDIAEVIGSEPVRMRFQAAVARGLRAFVGRQTELDAVQRVLEQAQSGQGQIITLVGEPGVGKSRLCWELSRVARARGWLLLETGGMSYARGFAYGAVAWLLRTYFQIEDRDDRRRIQEKVTTKLLALDEAHGAARPAVLGLLGLPVEDPEWLEIDPLTRRQRTNAAVLTLLLRASAGQPLCLVLEDLHWIDEETLTLLDEIGEKILSAPILIVATHRPEHHQLWRPHVRNTEIRLGPLRRPSVAELLDDRLGCDPALAPLKTSLVERTAGNPLFLEESVRTLVETGVLVGAPGEHRLGGGPARIEMPASVQAILAARIDRLPPPDKSVLQALAAAGRDMPLPLLCSVCRVPEEALRAGLNRLRDGGFLYEAQLYPELTYAVSHELMREVAYGSLVQERRQMLHADIVRAVEELHGERTSEQVEDLAHHAYQGHEWAKALAYLHRAGLRAASRSAYREAVAYYERGLSVLPRLPDTRENRERNIDIRVDLRNALFPLGEILRDFESLQSALPVAEALGDQRRLGRLLAYVARDHSLLGRPLRAVELGLRARGIADRIDDAELGLVTDAYLGAAHYALGNYRRAADLLRGVLAEIPAEHVHHGFGLPGPGFVFFTSWLVWSLARLGDFAEGTHHAQAAVEIAAGSEQPLSLMVASYSAGSLSLQKGDLHTAVPMLERALELCERWTLRAWFPNVASNLGYAYTLSGRPAEGCALLERAVEQNAALATMTGHASEVAMLAEGHLVVGRLDKALELARQAQELARAYQERGNEAQALCVLGDVLAHGAGNLNEALEAYAGALRLARELEMRPLLYRCHLSLAALHRRAGDDPRAVSETAEAAALDQALGMRLRDGQPGLAAH
jgi:class 3 adenylate cyclase/tetratricopeptide (TPR) repeat protein